MADDTVGNEGLERLAADVQTHAECDMTIARLTDEVDQLRGDVARVTDERDQWALISDVMEAKRDEFRETVDRLRSELEEMRRCNATLDAEKAEEKLRRIIVRAERDQLRIVVDAMKDYFAKHEVFTAVHADSTEEWADEKFNEMRAAWEQLIWLCSQIDPAEQT